MLSCVYRIDNLSKWLPIYINAIKDGDILIGNRNELIMVDLDFDGIPEMILKNNNSMIRIYTIYNRKVKCLGYQNIDELCMNKNKITGQLSWIVSYKLMYKYGNTYCWDEIHINKGKLENMNLFTFNEDCRGASSVYYSIKGDLIDKVNYYREFLKYWNVMDRIHRLSQ